MTLKELLIKANLTDNEMDFISKSTDKSADFLRRILNDYEKLEEKIAPESIGMFFGALEELRKQRQENI